MVAAGPARLQPWRGRKWNTPHCVWPRRSESRPGRGLVVVADGHRDEAAPLAQLVRGIEVVVVGWGGRGLPGEGVSAFVTGPRLPLRDGVARGVAVAGGSGEGWLGECRRVVMPGGRIVITGATDEARAWVAASGLMTLLDEGGVVVGGVAAPGSGPRMGRWVGGAGGGGGPGWGGGGGARTLKPWRGGSSFPGLQWGL